MSPPPDLSAYRACAGVMLMNTTRQVFVAKRIDMPSDAWQMPQGGIDAGESPREAALRELHEETGTDKAELLYESVDWYFYDLPPELQGKLWGGSFKGQRQKWFLMRFTGDDRDINLETGIPEFSEWKWASLSDVPLLIVPFKKRLYESVIEEFSPIIKQHF